VSEDRNERSDRPAMERAEELVDRLLQEAGHLLSVAALNLLKGASLAREEAEDFGPKHKICAARGRTPSPRGPAGTRWPSRPPMRPGAGLRSSAWISGRSRAPERATASP
jgi:hypothetical protein